MSSTDFRFSDPAPTLAVVTAATDLRDVLLDLLRSRGMAVWAALSELDFYRELAVRQADLMLVDLDLPDGAGSAILAHLAPSGAYGLAALAAPSAEAAARAHGIQCCITKPIQATQLLYRLAMLWENRSQEQTRPSGWWLDPAGPRLVAPDGRSIRLTTTEQRLMGGLMACHGQTLTKDQLIAMLWGKRSDRDYHGVEVLLSRLRHKARLGLGQELPVRAVQAVGLVFAGRVTPNVP